MTTSNNSHPAALPLHALLAECDLHRGRSSGPGGQHRNKVETAIVIHHRPTHILAQACERRSQADNQHTAIHRLRIHLALAVRRPVREQDQPSPLWLKRCRHSRISVNPKHEDYPAILAEALDLVAGCAFDLKIAASRLHCTPSQLLKLLKTQPQALQWINTKRRTQGLRPLK